MKRFALACTAMLATMGALGDDLSGVDELLCSVSRVLVCAETGECFDVQPWEADVPQFVVIDTRRKTISTTRASEEQRSTPFTGYLRGDGTIYLQGIQSGRAFSFVIDEATGLATVAVSRDGLSVNVFGACTDANVKGTG
jgi:hypothetical protein